jgi:hypothetical protein
MRTQSKLCVCTMEQVKKSSKLKTYSELIRRTSFEERYDYLRIGGAIGIATFGSSRYLNQSFYTSYQWRRIRDEVILRDNGCDLGMSGYQIFDKVVIHHMNPVTEDDLYEMSPFLIDPEFLICVSPRTHNAIHYGDAQLLPALPIVRSRNDTSPWLS